ncbi:hypothetical protein PINS_up018381 [Pythium insidiosum]|nr:hypothetical protein PINS_up018381 [Pythium insidiosum]
MAGQPPPDGFDAKDCVRGGAPPCGVDCSPVCGSDGVTYQNYCWFKWTQVCGGSASLTPVARGPCKAPDSSWKPAKCEPGSGSSLNGTDCAMMICPRSSACGTVCGSDGLGYADECSFRAAKCRNSSLVIVKGPCPPPKYTSCITPEANVTPPPPNAASGSTVSTWSSMAVAVGAIATVALEWAL